jgi:soluble lytic murein transglycosylase-like protein
MATLSRDEIRSAASKAGFSGDDLNIAVAVAFAESGGNPRSHNSTPPDNSYGLMQINMLGGMGPDRRAKFNLKSNEDLYDPDTNMRVAYGIFKGSGWKAWTTYTRGTYKKFLTGGDSGGSGGGDAVAATTSANPINGIGDAINAFGGTIFKGFANLAGIAVAIVLLVLGVVLLARGQLANVLPAGKVAKIAKGLAK